MGKITAITVVEQTRKNKHFDEPDSPFIAGRGEGQEIPPQKRKKQKYTIWVDGIPAVQLDEDVIVKLMLRVGQDFDPGLQQSIDETQLFQKAMDTSLRYLEARMRTRKEMTARLKRGEFSQEIIDKVLIRLSELALIDDADFAARWVSSRTKIEGGRPIGRKRLQNELYAKGVAKDQIEEAVESLSDDQELSLALKAAQKKVRHIPLNRDDLYAERRRLAAFLQRRGFTWEICKQVIDQVLPVHGDDE